MALMSYLDVLKNYFGYNYYEVAQDTPILKTVAATPEPLMGQIPYKWVLSYLIKLRTLGTATYVGIGDQFGQDFRLTVIGETFGFSANPRECFDLSKVWITSDSNDAQIEIVIGYIPIPMQDYVVYAPDRGIGG